MDFTNPETYYMIGATVFLVLSELLPFLPCKANGIVDIFRFIIKNKGQCNLVCSVLPIEDSNTVKDKDKKNKNHVEEYKDKESSTTDETNTGSSSEEVIEIFIESYDSEDINLHCVEKAVENLIKLIKKGKKNKIDKKAFKNEIKNILHELKF